MHSSGIHGPKLVGPGPIGPGPIGPGPRKFRNSGPARTRTETILEKLLTWDRIGPEPRKNSKSGTGLDQDQEKFPNLGPDQDHQNFENLGPIPWIPGTVYTI